MAGDAQEVTMDLYLDAKETELLTGLLERYLEDIRREIHHTDRAQFKAALKSDEALMRRLLQKVKVPVPMGI
jgi:metal-dependent HD superfamily phosphatase/phosphodiesterase